MPNFPWPGRRDVSAISDASLSALLAGAELPAGSPPGLRPVAEALAALTAAPAGDELTGEAEALAVFRDRLGVPSPTRRPRRRPALLAPLLSARAAAAAAVAALGIGGFATAAFAGALPAPAQQFAHHTIGAPAAHASQPTAAHASQPTSTHPSATDTPAGPDATGPAASGLCTAYAHAKAHGSASQKAVAFRDLAAAAGGAAKIAAYCAAVPHPGSSQPGQPAPAPTHPAGRPASHPTGKPSSQRHTPHPAGRPSSAPSPH
jgi:hypothetical protein